MLLTYEKVLLELLGEHVVFLLQVPTRLAGWWLGGVKIALGGQVIRWGTQNLSLVDLERLFN